MRRPTRTPQVSIAARPESWPRFRPAHRCPRFLWSYDDGGWVALCFEDVDGRHPHEPWTEPDLALVIAALKKMAKKLTPSPFARGSPRRLVSAKSQPAGRARSGGAPARRGQHAPSLRHSRRQPSHRGGSRLRGGLAVGAPWPGLNRLGRHGAERRDAGRTPARGLHAPV